METSHNKLDGFAADVKGRRVAIIGVGISNRPLIDMLLSFGAVVTARDRKPRERFPFAGELEEKGVTLILGDDYLNGLNEEIIFKAPGIRRDLPELMNAAANGASITTEMELFFELCPARIFGVTGSDGKTTTTTLIYKLLEAEGKCRVWVGGNIGRPLLPEVGKMTSDDFVVVELSSFQLHCMTRSPETAVVTNVSPNHLDWHKGMEEYIDAKKNIFRYQDKNCRLVLNRETEITRNMAAEACADVTFFAHDPFYEESRHCVYERDGIISCDGDPVLDTREIVIPGRHNVENYMAAIAATRGFVCSGTIRKVAGEFGGVEHRCELVRIKDGVRYFNSSIDSSPTRTAAALSNFKCRVIVICGGYDKHIPFEPLGETLCRHAAVAVLTGATAGKIKDAVLGCPLYDPSKLKLIDAACFDDAVYAAAGEAACGDVVLLSPACASFDAFANFEERGNRFKALVNAL